MGGVASGAGNYLAAKEQADVQQKIFKSQREALANASELLRTGFEERVSDAKAGKFEGLFGLDEIFGTKPGVEAFAPVSLQGEQARAIRANLANLPAAQALASAYSEGFTQDALNRVRAITPGFDRSQSQMARNAGALLEGEIPADVAEAVASARAEMAGASGMFGGANNLVARDLGLTSLDLQNRGASLFQSMVNQANQISPVAGQTAAASFGVSPAQQTDLSFRQNLIDQSTRQNQANIGAAATPAAEALFQASLANLGGEAGTLAGVAGLQTPVAPGLAQARGQLYGAGFNALGGVLGIPGFSSPFGGGGLFGGASPTPPSSGPGSFANPLQALPPY